jgi:3,4-dihydroxy 2-butanone 4-phosphate synthase / GTP cyclohydrolase II
MANVIPLSGKSASGTGAGLHSVEEIVADLKAGRMVIIIDDEDRENEGDLIMAAERATSEAVAFMIRHTSGIICVPMEEELLSRLDLPQMVQANSESHRTAFTVSVDLRIGTTTGVSSSDRAATIRALADPAATAQQFARPGHIFPLRPRKGGVLVRAGHTEAAVDLCRLAGLKPVGVLCEVMNDDGTMARRLELEEFGRRHNLKIGTIADLIRYRLRNERSIERISEQTVQTELGEFRLYAYEDRMNRDVHLALARGRLDGPTVPLVRVHVADTLRDLLGVRGNSRAWTLRAAMSRIAQAGNGVIVILRDHESPDDLASAVAGLASAGLSATGTAGVGPGVATAAGAASENAGVTERPQEVREVLRTYGVGAQILKDLGVRRMRVLSAPKQIHGISAFGLEIEGYVGEEG